VLDNVQQLGFSWLWTSCPGGNRYSNYDLEAALSTAVVRASVTVYDTSDDLTESLDELKLSLMTAPGDVANNYEDLKVSVADLLNE
jgi:hypothetical protein